MSEVTDKVKKILGKVPLTDEQLDIMEEVLTLILNDKCPLITGDKRMQLLVYLLAHFVVLNEGGGLKSKKIGDASVTYADYISPSQLSTTKWGNIVLMLSDGCLTPETKNTKTSIRVLN